MVVANAVAALAEIAEVSGKDVLQVTRESIKKLLRALNECTEWGQARPNPPVDPSRWAWGHQSACYSHSC